MTGYSLFEEMSQAEEFNDHNHDVSSMWYGIVHSPLDINSLEEIPGSRMYAIPVHEFYPTHTWTWEVWFEWEYPRHYPITITGQWEPAWEVVNN